MPMAKNPQARQIILFVLIIAPFCSLARARIIYVDKGAPGANDGSSWTDAHLCLQNALAVARSGDELRVAQGNHRPDQQFVVMPRTGPQVVSSGDRTATFQLRDGVSVRGGYAGFSEPDPNARDIRLYETILSGDLKGNDGPGFADNAENSYHVVTGSGAGATAVLDGFTVTGGNASDASHGGYGGGMYNSLCSVTVTHCTFSGNCATRGAGMANTGDVNRLSVPTVTNCTFSGNRARWGGGMCVWQYCGGTLTNCVFSGNTAEDGAAIFIARNSEATLRNCTLAGNWASVSDAGGIDCSLDCSAVLVNTILWDNSPHEIDFLESSITVTYSDVQVTGRPWPGEGNINADPLFADPHNGDYHLKSRAGRWIPSSQIWVQDDVTSPCIDAGDPNSPLAFEPFPNGGVINMGAYGGTAEASKSPSGLHAKYNGGTGEPNNPYRIATAEELMLLSESPEDYDKHFILTADVDLSTNLPDRKVFDHAVIAPDANDVESGFQGTPFTGVFDGNSHTV